MARAARAIWIGVPIAVIAIAAVTYGRVWFEARSERSRPPQFVGAAKCASCHDAEATAWRSSQHAVSMQIARNGTVLGDFSGAALTADGLTSRFFQRDGRYYVNTQGDDGVAHDYEIRWTFGVYPLQQYIVELKGGRSQALTIAWDSRPRNEGGQRWFSLTPGHGLQPQDPLHWTGREYNWNYSCA